MRFCSGAGWGCPLVIEFRVSPETLVRRVAGRWTCTVGGETYNVFERSPKVPGICDNDGGRLVQRSDDQPEIVQGTIRGVRTADQAAGGLLPDARRAGSGGW